jgi:hypothetical protein
VIRRDLAHDPDFRRRFRGEVQAARPGHRDGDRADRDPWRGGHPP